MQMSSRHEYTEFLSGAGRLKAGKGTQKNKGTSKDSGMHKKHKRCKYIGSHRNTQGTGWKTLRVQRSPWGALGEACKQTLGNKGI